jgi:hypothetical protein
MFYDDWSRSLSDWFPARDPVAAQQEWNAVKKRLAIGQPVSGIVVAKAPFGAWLDIGVGFPALLLIPDVAGLTPQSYRANEWCPVGSAITAEIAIFNDAKFEVRVSQGTPHENRARTPRNGLIWSNRASRGLTA